MAAPYHKLLSKSDRGLAAYIVATVTGVTGLSGFTHSAKRSLNKSAPCVICYAEGWQPDPGNTAAAIIKASITVKTKGSLQPNESEPVRRLESDLLVGKIFDVFYLSEDGRDFTPIADAITAAARAKAIADATNYADLADFKCDEFMVTGGELAFDESNSTWIDTLNVEMHCRAVTDTEP